MKKSTRELAWILLGLMLMQWAGCLNRIGSVPTSKAQVVLPSGAKVVQSGSVQSPAVVAVAQATAEIALPKDSVVTIVLPTQTTPGNISVAIRSVSSLKLNTNFESVSMPRNFAPPEPPSPASLARASGQKLFYWIAGGLVLLTLGLAYTEHFKAAIISGIGAVATPILGNFVSETSSLVVGLIATVGAGTLYAAWYLLKGKTLPVISQIETSVEKVVSHT